jgi:Alpha/beta hydrolase family
MTTFALVHGAWHGAWCWRYVIRELDGRGHRALAMDLPNEDPRAGAEHYASVVVEALEGVDEDVVLVGHSLAGLTIPVVACLRPVRRLVYLSALVPRPGAAWDEVAAEQPVFGHYQASVPAVSHPDGSASCPEERALELFYHDCPADMARWAARRLRRQHWPVSQERTPLVAFPKVPANSIVCEADRAVNPVWSRAAARSVLGVEPIELDGGHSPFLAQPATLAEVLHRLVSGESERGTSHGHTSAAGASAPAHRTTAPPL